MTICNHEAGVLNAEFVKFITPEQLDPQFEMHITSHCKKCGMKFRFAGHPIGHDAQHGTTVSASGYTMHIQLKPSQHFAFTNGNPESN